MGENVLSRCKTQEGSSISERGLCGWEEEKELKGGNQLIIVSPGCCETSLGDTCKKAEGRQ